MKSTRIKFAVIGAILLVYGIISVLKLGPDAIGNFGFMFFSVPFFLMALFLRRLQDVGRGKIGLVMILISIIFIIFAVNEFKFVGYSRNVASSGSQWAIVLAETADSQYSSRELEKSYEKVKEYMTDNPSCKAVLPDESIGAYLTDAGVSAGRIVYAKSAKTLHESFENSLEAMISGGGAYSQKVSLFVPKHQIYRVALFATVSELEKFSIQGFWIEPLLYPQHFAWEFNSYIENLSRSYYRVKK